MPNSHERILARLMQRNPKTQTTAELQRLFLDLSKRFTSQLENCKDVEQLEDLQRYIKAVALEIERRDGK
jgi:hypothetical protein